MRMAGRGPRPETKLVKNDACRFNHRIRKDRRCPRIRREQRIHPVAERGGPERRLHGAGLHLVHSTAAVHAGDERGIEAQKLREPLAIALLGRIGDGRKQRPVLAIVEARIGIVFGRGAGIGAGCVVRRSALRQQEESASAPLMVGKELLQTRAGPSLAAVLS